MRFLLVDDNPVKLDLLRQLLNKEMPGCLLKMAENGREALALAAKQNFDVAFVDVQMPGMDGLEVCRRLKGNPATAGIHVVLITAHQADSNLRIAGLDAGAFDFITQPIRNAELMARLRSLLRVKQLEDELLEEAAGLKQTIAEQASTMNWLTGLFSFASDADGESIAGDLKNLLDQTDRNARPDLAMMDRKIFIQFPEDLRTLFLQLALLGTIPHDMVSDIFAQDSVGDIVDYLVRHDFLVEARRDNQTFIGFRNELGSFLQNLAAQELPVEQITQTYRQAAEWFSDNGLSERALEIALRSGSPELAEEVCAREFCRLLVENILPLQQVREFDLGATGRDGYGPWLTVMVAISCQGSSPGTCKELLENTIDHFEILGEWRGVLISKGLLLEQFLLLEMDEDKAGLLLPGIKEALSTPDVRQDEGVCRFLEDLVDMAGQIFPLKTHRLFGPGDPFGQEIEEQKEARTQVGYLAAFHRSIVDGASQSVQRFIGKEYFTLLGKTTPLQRTWFDLLLSRFMLLRGELEMAEDVLASLMKRLPSSWLGNTRLGLIVKVMDVELMLMDGRASAAWEAIRNGGWENIQSEPLRLWVALLTRLAKPPEAIADNGTSTLNGELGAVSWPFDLHVGMAALATGDYELASENFRQVVETTEPKASPLSLACGRIGMSILSEQQGRPQNPQMLAEGVAFFRRSDYRVVPYLVPDLRRSFYQLALKYSESPEWIRVLARDDLKVSLVDEGSPRPLLKVNALGPFTIGTERGTALKSDDLTVGLRQLLAMLMLAPEQKLPQEQVQLAFWPESGQTQARSKLDSLLLRLRKSLIPIVGDEAAKHHIKLQRGVLVLEDCLIDLAEFREKVRTGLRQQRRGEHCQAEISFRAALRLWRGPFSLELPEGALFNHILEDLKLLLTDACLALNQIYLTRQDSEQAEKVLRFGLRQEPCQDELMEELLAFYRERGQSVRAAGICAEYEQALVSQGFSPDEAKESLQLLRQVDTE